MENVNLFRNPQAANLYYKMAQGILDKLEDNYPDLDQVIVECPGEPRKHFIHMIYAIVGFQSNPLTEVTPQSASNFLVQIESKLKEEGCIISREFLAKFYLKMRELCKNEFSVWHDLQIVANEHGLDAIDEDLINAMWEVMPDNDGELYEDIEADNEDGLLEPEDDLDFDDAENDDTTPEDVVKYLAFRAEEEIEEVFDEEVDAEIIEKVICVILQTLAEGYVFDNVAEMAKAESLVAGYDIDDDTIIRLVQEISTKCERYIDLTRSAASLLEAGKAPQNVLKKMQQSLGDF